MKIRITHLTGRFKPYEVSSEDECRTQTARDAFYILLEAVRISGVTAILNGLIKAEIVKENE